MQVVAGGRAVLHLPADRAADLHYAGSVVTVLEVDDIGNKVRVRLEEGDVWVSKDAVQMVSQARIESGEGLGAGGGGVQKCRFHFLTPPPTQEDGGWLGALMGPPGLRSVMHGLISRSECFEDRILELLVCYQLILQARTLSYAAAYAGTRYALVAVFRIDQNT